MGYYDDMDYEEFYGEPSEFDKEMENLKDTLRASVKNEIKIELDSAAERNARLVKENNELQDKLKACTNEVKTDKQSAAIADIFKQQLTKDNIKSVIEAMFDVTFDEDTYDCPLWWGLFARFYNNRNEVLKLLRLVGIKIPEEAYTIVFPHEWDQTLLDKFFERANNNYLTNGNQFEKNLQHWDYRSAAAPFANRESIPWQFVLRNPLLNTPENAAKIVDLINYKMSYNSSGYFCEIQKYQNLDKDVLKLLVNGIKPDEKAKGDSCVNAFLLNNVELIESEDALDVLFDKAVKLYRGITFIKRFPEKYQIRYLELRPRLEDFVRDAKELNVDQSEKLRILATYVEASSEESSLPNIPN